ncbi:MAG: response regulator transcription factor [Chitinophagaceae bacterium]|nr:response regulator transcription factor [Chitinophagaceae bacterium]
MTKKISIFEDNEALRKSLEELILINNGFEVSGVFGNCLEASKHVKDNNPDILLMDINMPGMTGIEAVKKIRAFNTSVIIIMLTVFDDNKNVFDAICAGATGYLLKKHVSDKLIPAIQEALEGGAPMSPSIAKMIVQSMQQNKANDYKFTNREQEILEHLCKGSSYKMIAAEINLSFETIRTYIKRIYEKLQVHSATEAVSKALNEKLI